MNASICAVLIVGDVWHNQWSGSALRQHELHIDLQVSYHYLFHLRIRLQLPVYVLALLKGLHQTTTPLYLALLPPLALSTALGQFNNGGGGIVLIDPGLQVFLLALIA